MVSTSSSTLPNRVIQSLHGIISKHYLYCLAGLSPHVHQKNARLGKQREMVLYLSPLAHMEIVLIPFHLISMHQTQGHCLLALSKPPLSHNTKKRLSRRCHGGSTALNIRSPFQTISHHGNKENTARVRTPHLSDFY